MAQGSVAPQELRIKADSFPCQSHVHFPTDINLLWDAARKCFDTIEHLHQERPWPGWRKRKATSRQLKRRYHRLSSIKGRNRAQRQREAAPPYLKAARNLADRVLNTLKLSQGMSLSIKEIAHLEALAYYHEHLCRQIDLLHRRVIKGEAIPHEEKVFSIFEPHVQWINKGKRHIDIGHPVLIASDQHHFILSYKVLDQGQADVETALPMAQALCERYGVAKLRSLSLDRGFYSQENRQLLLQYVEELILPKKGKKSQQEALDEGQDEFVALKDAHSAVESNINQLHANGLDHCPDRSQKGFRRYVAYGVLAYNLHRLGSLIIREERAQAAAEAHRHRANAAA